jgi:hypothetical protein
LWTGLYDRQHVENVRLERELALAKADAREQKSMYMEALWTLHELSNGAGIAAIALYRAGQLQERIPYEARNRLQTRIWNAEKGMNSQNAQHMYPGRQ